MTVELPVLSTGNDKTGKCIILSRPVGDTCSNDCPFLTGRGVPSCARCYADRCEKRLKQTRSAVMPNMRVSKTKMRNALQRSVTWRVPFRFHARGDFGNGRLQQIDARYVSAVESALASAPAARVWTYTHIYHARLAQLSKRPNMTVYASVHTRADVKRAKRAGFERFALVLPVRANPNGSPQLRGLPLYDGPQTFKRYGRTWVVCPGMYNARGGKHPTCVECGICIKGRANIALPLH